MSATTRQLRSPLAAVQSWVGIRLSRGLDSRFRPLFTGLRRCAPIINSRAFVVVSRDVDVREILARREAFSVQLYGIKMEELSGPFFLGIDDIAAYEHDHMALRRAVRADDLGALAVEVTELADELVARARPKRRIDVVGELSDPLVAHTIATYFGTPGPDPATLLRWSRILFQQLFYNVTDDPKIHGRAMAAAGEMCAYLDERIATRKRAIEGGEPGPDDVLRRLIQAQGGAPPFLDDRAIRNNLLGLIAGWMPLVSKAVALVFDELLNRPADLVRARLAALDDDDRRLAAYCFEALRLRPPNIGLLRVCVADTTVARGARRQARIRAGATVLALTQSAMLDPETIDAPTEFRTDRPYGDYLHWGYGLHTCFGQGINRMQIPLIVKAVLRGGPVVRGAGRQGRIGWEGPFPRSLEVAFTAAQSVTSAEAQKEVVGK